MAKKLHIRLRPWDLRPYPHKRRGAVHCLAHIHNNSGLGYDNPKGQDNSTAIYGD